MDAELGSDINFDKLETMRDFDMLLDNRDKLTLLQRVKLVNEYYNRFLAGVAE